MSQIAIRDMDPAEARAAVEGFVSSGMYLRWQLLVMFERKAYKALHYDNFEDFADKELHLVMDKANLSRLVHWAEVERNISGEKLSIGQLSGQQLSTAIKSIPKIPRTVALELAKLPDADAQRKAWEEYYTRSEAHKSGQVGVRYATNELKHVVASTLAVNKTAPVKPIKAKPAPTPAPTAAPALAVSPPAPREVAPPHPAEEAPTQVAPMDWEEAEWFCGLAQSWIRIHKAEAPEPSLIAAAATLRRVADWIEKGVS